MLSYDFQESYAATIFVKSRNFRINLIPKSDHVLMATIALREHGTMRCN
jgi:hypothetical protein